MVSTTTATEEEVPAEFSNFRVIIPLSMTAMLIALITASIILLLIIFTKRLHTVTHLLICNSSITSIFYCVVQCVNYVFLTLVSWEINDSRCRWRAFFGYMAVAAVVYSYLAQAISRFLISVLSIRYRWATSFKTHILLILLQWFIVVLLPLPALLTEDIYHRPSTLCWVPKEYTLHVLYTAIAYYVLPALSIFAIYISIYLRIKRRGHHISVLPMKRRSNRDLEVLYNIMILFAIYTLGAIPTILYMSTGIRFLYGLGLISVSVTVAIEKLVTLLLDRDMRTILKLYFRRSMIHIRPIT